MKAEDMAAESLKKARADNKQWMIDAARSDWNREHAMHTDMFQCKRCKERKCTWYQKQTRYVHVHGHASAWWFVFISVCFC
jgi:transcription elongation factor S-II